jgi:hypothetical protein
MPDQNKRVFAGRGIPLPPWRVTVLTISGAFLLGIIVAWASSFVPQFWAADITASASPSATSSALPSPTPSVSVPALPPITRELTDEDLAAGVASFDFPLEAEGTFTVASRDGASSAEAAALRWVRVEFEDGLAIGGTQLSSFVLDALNDPRGWGAKGRYEFVPTQGAADVRVVIASPLTAAALCSDPHLAATQTGVTDTGPSSSPTPSATPSAAVSCADQDYVVLSFYDWAAGLESYQEDVTGSRIYLLHHFLGHVLGNEDVTCSTGEANVMVIQSELDEDCTVNPWPNPDEPLPSPEPSVSATPVPTN